MSTGKPVEGRGDSDREAPRSRGPPSSKTTGSVADDTGRSCREPVGLLGLAKAQIHQQQWDAARQTIKLLKTKSWPARFRSVDVEVTRLLAEIEGK